MEADLPAVPEKSGDVVVRIDSQGSTPRKVGGALVESKS